MNWAVKKLKKVYSVIKSHKVNSVKKSSVICNTLSFPRKGVITERHLCDIIYALQQCKNSTKVRLDLRRGFFPADIALVNKIKGILKELTLGIDVLSSRTMSYSRNGYIILPDETILKVKKLAGDSRLCLIIVPSDLIRLGLNKFSDLVNDIQITFKKKGIEFSEYALPFTNSPDILINQIWIDSLNNNTFEVIPSNSCETFCYTEWISPSSKMVNGLPKLKYKSYLDNLCFSEESEVTPYYSRFFDAVLNTAPTVTRTPEGELLIYTDWDGWHIIHANGEQERVTFTNLKRIIANVSKGKIQLIVDCNHISHKMQSEDSSEFRSLPYPFHHYISINSDIDWSQYNHIEDTAKIICDELGLPLSGSTYTFSPEKTWPSWSNDDLYGCGLLQNHYNYGLIDTFHGLSYSFDTVHFVLDRYENGVSYFKCDRKICLSKYDGILVELSDRDASPPIVNFLSASGKEVKLNLADSYALKNGTRHHYRHKSGDEQIYGSVLLISLSRKVSAEFVLSVQTTFATRTSLDELLEKLHADNISVPLLTMHGGGVGTRTYGVPVTEKALLQKNENFSYSMDDKNSPYYVGPIYKSNGVAFFNPVGLFASSNTVNLDKLLSITKNKDGSESYIFSRFTSQRFHEDGTSPNFGYGKRTSSTQGLPYNLKELFQRLQNTGIGEGALIYTHLGHRVGNQNSLRLGWNEELMSALSLIAENYHGIDIQNPCHNRLWIAPTSQILQYSLIMRYISNNTHIDAKQINISSWFDPVLRQWLPNYETYQDAWLHGVTIYVQTFKGLSISLDQNKLKYYVRNMPDSSGKNSVTIVNSTNKIRLASGVSISSQLNPGVKKQPIIDNSFNYISQCSVDVPNISLRNVSHWTFRLRVRAPINKIEIGICTNYGHTFLFGNTEQCYWNSIYYDLASTDEIIVTLPLVISEMERKCSKHTERINGSVCNFSINVTTNRGYDGPVVEVDDVFLIRPLPPRKMRKQNARILAGKVYNKNREPISQKITIKANGEALSVYSNTKGFYKFKNLPPDCLVEFISMDEYDYEYRYSEKMLMTSDYWDCNIVQTGAV